VSEGTNNITDSAAGTKGRNGSKHINSKPTLNPKSEYRNPKQFQNPNDQITKTFPILGFEFWSFEFVSKFGFRASDLNS